MKLLKQPLLYLCLILIFSFVVKLYKIDSTVADWHSWRQADTAAVARFFYQNGFNPFIPKYDDMSVVSDTGLPNPGRYRFVEFPIYNSLVYFGYLINNGVEIKIARLVSVFISLGSIILLYLIAKKHFSVKMALLSAFIFGLLPYNIFYSRTVLPETTLVFFCLGMFYFVNRWIYENKWWLFLVAIFFTASAFLTKPMAIFYLLPLLYSYRQKEQRWFPVPWRYLLFLVLALTPFGLWRLWIAQHPEGIPASGWLLNGNGIRLRPAFWRWILVDRFNREILSVVGVFVFFLGLVFKPQKKENALLHLTMLSMFLYLIIFATGNVQHDYYQALIVPILAVFTARGFLLLISNSQLLPRLFMIPMAVLFFLLMFYFTWFEIRGLYQINNNHIVIAGEEADRLLPKEAVVLAPYGGDTAFLYHVNRPGFAFIGEPLDEFKKKYKVTHLVSLNYDDVTNEAIKKYTVMKQDPRFVIIDLSKKNPAYLQENPTQ